MLSHMNVAESSGRKECGVALVVGCGLHIDSEYYINQSIGSRFEMAIQMSEVRIISQQEYHRESWAQRRNAEDGLGRAPAPSSIP